MTTVRLNRELKEKIETISQTEHITKSDVIKQALEIYFSIYYSEKTPYELGEVFFGIHGSGRKDSSTNYKEIIRKKIYEKRNH
ncbi:MAG: ribbon-helix-helix protein, CopG family [Leptospirales bacterium]